MDYKAKYEEALERAKEIKSKILSSHLSTESCKAVSEYIDTIIPELAESESEDEEEIIRKELLFHIQSEIDTYDNMISGDYDSRDKEDKKVHSMLKRAKAYLEKQKDSIPYEKYVYDIAAINAEARTKYHAGWNDGYEVEQKDRMYPIYNDKDSFESALEKAWKSYNDCGSRTVDGCEDNYVECAHAKGFREGYLFGLEKKKEQKPTNSYKPTYEQMEALRFAVNHLAKEHVSQSVRLSIMYDHLKEQKEQKPAEGKYYSSPDCGTTACCTNDESSEFDKGYRAGKAYQLKQTEQYKKGYDSDYNTAYTDSDKYHNKEE